MKLNYCWIFHEVWVMKSLCMYPNLPGKRPLQKLVHVHVSTFLYMYCVYRGAFSEDYGMYTAYVGMNRAVEVARSEVLSLNCDEC